MSLVVPFLVGVLFSIGLGLSKMSQPQTVNAFLDLGGSWSAQLLVVMASAVLTYGLLFRVVLGKREKPILAPRFMVPTNRQLTVPLILGSAIFGVGWGLTGLCPGPALSTVNTGDLRPVLFLVTMTAGMWLYGQYNAFQQRHTHPTHN